METVDQPTAMPTNKVLATAIVTALVNGLLVVLNAWEFTQPIAASIPAQEWIALGAGVIAGYFVRDEKNT
ncbi:MAG: hypothetical protein AAFR21_14920 [Pseudomonadota bacterium]